MVSIVVQQFIYILGEGKVHCCNSDATYQLSLGKKPEQSEILNKKNIQ